jgi:hypothetical protein
VAKDWKLERFLGCFEISKANLFWVYIGGEGTTIGLKDMPI